MTRQTEAGSSLISSKVTELVLPVVEEFGYELVEVVFRREQHGMVLRILIFSPDGIGINDCARLSREVNQLLDIEDFIDGGYSLEVSSPGLDRPLVTARDFARYPGRRISVVMRETFEEFVGEIAGVDQLGVVMDIAGERELIPFERIQKARLVIEFGK